MSTQISKTIRGAYPSLPYEEIANTILGKKYDVSLVFIGAKRARSLNETYRKKTYVPNVLSFPLDSHTGEIFITPEVTQKEAVKFNLSPKGYIGYLFIHALLHLKGHHHGATMEKAEKRYVSLFGLS